MKRKTKSLEGIKRILQKEKEFNDILSWKFKHIPLGEMHHTYKISKGNKIYFLKEIMPQEAQMEYFLTKLKLKQLPYSKYPHLLKKKILVRDFIKGKMLKNKEIQPSLIKEFAKMRNKLADKRFFDNNNPLGIESYSQKNNGFYTKGLKYDLDFAPKRLNQLKKIYQLPIIDKYFEILKHIKENKQKVLEIYEEMPLAKQHQDLREDNIIVEPGNKQKLIDWGRSYGYNPFMYDVAPFLIKNPKTYSVFVKNSNICKRSSKKQINEWLYSGLIARFTDLVRYHLDPKGERADTKQKCKKLMEYEYKTYKELLKWKI